MTREVLGARSGRFVVGGDTVDLLAGPAYLYVGENRLGIPTNVMFFPQDEAHFTGYDPATRALTRLELAGRSLTFTLADGRRVTADRQR